MNSLIESLIEAALNHQLRGFSKNSLRYGATKQAHQDRSKYKTTKPKRKNNADT